MFTKIDNGVNTQYKMLSKKLLLWELKTRKSKLRRPFQNKIWEQLPFQETTTFLVFEKSGAISFKTQ